MIYRKKNTIAKMLKWSSTILLWILITGCQTMKPIHTVETVDLNRFMGDWYVIASIPTFIEKKAFNAVESYRLEEDGTIATTFRFNNGSLDGPLKEYHPRGFIRDNESNALWGMQFIWPVKADYRVMYLSEDYTRTVIGRNKRDYVWIMARTPVIADTDYKTLVDLIADQGYDISKIRRVPQRHLYSGGQRP